MGDVHIKVSIARKQPMLDAATGKSVWASLGKHSALIVCLDVDQTLCVSAQRGFTFNNVSFLSQLCRTAQKAPTGTRGTKSCTVKISCDEEKKKKNFCFFILAYSFSCFCFNDISQLLKVSVLQHKYKTICCILH